ncbi:MAG: glycosyltransferase family 39 protein [Pirellulales bacterium]|nr:glycosyltransferase family 39 protein [Pirellulales bacterium]
MAVAGTATGSEAVARRRRELAFLAAIQVLLLGAWLDRPLHVDDPLFVWTAQHLLRDPLDFYGFDVNWYGQAEPMYQVTQNPPLACYWLAAFGACFGWGERVLHLAMWIPALAATAGAYRLAERWCRTPLAAALGALLTPAMLVSSTTLMCDLPLLALWTWAIYFWVVGCDTGSTWRLILAALLGALASLTKYFGICLLPLMLVYACWPAAEKRHLASRSLALAMFVAPLVVYQLTTRQWYGVGLLSEAGQYAADWSGHARSLPAQTIVALAMLGGCLPSAAFLAWFLLSRTQLLAAALGCLAAALVGAMFAGRFWPDARDLPLAPALLGVQLGTFAALGLGTLALALAEFRASRDRQTLLLLLWVLGTFVFAGFVNWTSNARSLLPLAPALGILLARRLERRSLATLPWAPWIAAAALALLVTWADYEQAKSARTAATALASRFGRSGTLWYQGHWGFQYYLDRRGARHTDRHGVTIARGDVLFIPTNNTNVEAGLPFDTTFETLARFDAPVAPAAAAMWMNVCGFYSSDYGPLPYVLGDVGPDAYFVVRAKADYRFELPVRGGLRRAATTTPRRSQ